MATQSEELIYNILKRSNCRVKIVRGHKYGGANFTSEPRNLTNLNTFQYSGARNESVGVYKKNGKLYLQKSRAKFQRNPNKRAASRSFAPERGFNKIVQQVVKVCYIIFKWFNNTIFSTLQDLTSEKI